MVKLLESLPVLNQADFPEIPEEIKNRDWSHFIAVPYGSAWLNAEVEMWAGTIATACFIRKEWVPVPKNELGTILGFNWWGLHRSELNSAWNKLISAGDIEEVCAAGREYVVPTPQFANKVMNATAGRAQPRLQ